MSTLRIGHTANNALFRNKKKLLQLKKNIWRQLGPNIYGKVSSDFFGHSVSLNSEGNRVAIGAIFSDRNSDIDNNEGEVRVYEYTDSGWVQLGESIYGDKVFDQLGYSVSLNSEGNRVAMGVKFSDRNSDDNNEGEVRVYEYTDSGWDQLGESIYGDNKNDRLGHSVSLNSDGNRVAIGAIFSDRNSGIDNNEGEVRVCEYTDSGWVQLGESIYGNNIYDQLGYSVSLNSEGNRVAIGAIFSGSNFEGEVRVYEYNNTNNTNNISSGWVQLGESIYGKENDMLGHSVSLNSEGNRVVIGVIFGDSNDDIDSYEGEVRVYEYNDDDKWVQLGASIYGKKEHDRLGFSVSLNSEGNRVAIGAIFSDRNSGIDNNNEGEVRVYEYTDSGWVQLGESIYGNNIYDQLGYSVSLNSEGNRVAIGAISGDRNNNSSSEGEVRVYKCI